MSNLLDFPVTDLESLPSMEDATKQKMILLTREYLSVVQSVETTMEKLEGLGEKIGDMAVHLRINQA